MCGRDRVSVQRNQDRAHTPARLQAGRGFLLPEWIVSQEPTTSDGARIGAPTLRPALPGGAGVRALEVPDAAMDRIRGRAAAAYPEECCGILIGAAQGDIIVVGRELACPNAAPPSERRTRFEIDPRVVLNLTRALRSTTEQIVGFYHSHPDAGAAPSDHDLTYFRLWPDTAWLIVPVAEGAPAEPRAWWLPAGDGAEPREAAVRVRRDETGPAPCPE